MAATPLHSQQEIWFERPIEGLEIEYRHQGRMAILTFSGTISPQVADTTHAAVQRYVAAQKDGVRHMVYDATPAGVLAFNPYVSRKLTEMAEAYPNATGRVAIIVPVVGALRLLVEYFVRLKNNRLQPNLQVRLFGDRQKGINWVLETIGDSAPAASE